jgi:glycine C-acetyltransferase
VAGNTLQFPFPSPVERRMSTRAPFETSLFTHFVSNYAQPAGPDLLARTEPFFDWQDARRRQGLWPYSRSLDAAPRAA